MATDGALGLFIHEASGSMKNLWARELPWIRAGGLGGGGPRGSGTDDPLYVGFCSEARQREGAWGAANPQTSSRLNWKGPENVFSICSEIVDSGSTSPAKSTETKPGMPGQTGAQTDSDRCRTGF